MARGLPVSGTPVWQGSMADRLVVAAGNARTALCCAPQGVGPSHTHGLGSASRPRWRRKGERECACILQLRARHAR
jgi:hypothetical protein